MGGTLLLLSSQLTSCCPPSVCRVERSLFLCCCLCLIQFVPGLLSGLSTPSAHSLGPWYESLNWGCSVELPSSRLGRPKKGGVVPIGQGLSQPTPALQLVPWEGILKRTHSITWHFEGCLSQTHSLIQENRTFLLTKTAKSCHPIPVCFSVSLGCTHSDCFYVCMGEMRREWEADKPRNIYGVRKKQYGEGVWQECRSVHTRAASASVVQVICPTLY